ncbi:MAG: TIGR02710 family CRISPR-associated CARF protein, partial [Gemmataceae bacterium]
MATLILTVGGSHQPILASIQHNRPDHVIFICSEDRGKSPGSHIQVTGSGNVLSSKAGLEKPDLPNIVTLANLAPESFQMIKIDHFDDLNACYLASIQAIEQARAAHPREPVIIDYTGGTKSMTAGLAAAALDDGRCTFSLVVGRRTDLVKVQDRSEYVRPLPVLKVQMHRNWRAANELLARFDYRGAELILSQAAARYASEETRGLVENGMALCRGFDAWDRFDHALARQALEPLAKDFLNHWRNLKILAGEARGHNFELVEDLCLNAERRHLQGRNDDAVGRLYRALELTAQVWLQQHYEISTGNVLLEKVPSSHQAKLSRFAVADDSEKEPTIKIALLQAWDLIAAFPDDPLGKHFMDHRSFLVNFLSVRNFSLFAHGTNPIHERDYRSYSGRINSFLTTCLNLAVPPKLRSVPFT